jgi:hypothetical protein
LPGCRSLKHHPYGCHEINSRKKKRTIKHAETCVSLLAVTFSDITGDNRPDRWLCVRRTLTFGRTCRWRTMWLDVASDGKMFGHVIVCHNEGRATLCLGDGIVSNSERHDWHASEMLVFVCNADVLMCYCRLSVAQSGFSSCVSHDQEMATARSYYRVTRPDSKRSHLTKNSSDLCIFDVDNGMKIALASHGNNKHANMIQQKRQQHLVATAKFKLGNHPKGPIGAYVIVASVTEQKKILLFPVFDFSKIRRRVFDARAIKSLSIKMFQDRASKCRTQIAVLRAWEAESNTSTTMRTVCFSTDC